MRMKLAGAVIAAVLGFGMVFGVGQAAAASLPGGPLYGLKLTAEQARVGLTSDPEAQAELAAELAENRLDEIGRMMAAGKTVDGATAHKAQQQLSQAFQAMNQVNGEGQLQARNRLTNMIQSQHRVMALEVNGASEQQQESVQTLLRSMERVRVELHNGEGEASGAQIRNNRLEEPDAPDPADQPGNGPQAGQQADDGLLDATGETGSGGQGQGSMGPTEGESPGQGQSANPDQDAFGPNPNASFGPGSDTVNPPMGPYNEDDSSSDGPSHGPGPGEPQENPGKSQSGGKP